MTQVVRRRTVHAEAESIWRILADFGAISAWAPNVDHSSLTTDVSEGIDATRRVQAGRNTVLERVVEWEPGRALAYDITGLPKVVRSVTNRWTLTGHGSSTEVTLTSTVTVGNRPPQRVVERIVARILAKTSEQLLDGLTARVEGTNHD